MLDITKIDMTAPLKERKCFHHQSPCHIILYGKTHSIIQEDFGDGAFSALASKRVVKNDNLHNSIEDYEKWKCANSFKESEIIGVYMNQNDYVGTAMVLKDRDHIIEILIDGNVETILKEYAIKLDLDNLK